MVFASFVLVHQDMTEIWIVRHGQTDWNVERRLQGQADTDINAVGRLQATANGEHLATIVGDPAAFDFVASPCLLYTSDAADE